MIVIPFRETFNQELMLLDLFNYGCSHFKVEKELIDAQETILNEILTVFKDKEILHDTYIQDEYPQLYNKMLVVANIVKNAYMKGFNCKVLDTSAEYILDEKASTWHNDSDCPVSIENYDTISFRYFLDNLYNFNGGGFYSSNHIEKHLGLSDIPNGSFYIKPRGGDMIVINHAGTFMHRAEKFPPGLSNTRRAVFETLIEMVSS